MKLDQSHAWAFVAAFAVFAGIAAASPDDVMPTPKPYSTDSDSGEGRETGGQDGQPASPAPVAKSAEPDAEPQAEYVTEYVTEYRQVCLGDRCELRPFRVAKQVLRKTANAVANVARAQSSPVAGYASSGVAYTTTVSQPVVTSYQVYDAGPVSYGSSGTSYTQTTTYRAGTPLRRVVRGDGPVRRFVRCLLGR